MSGLRGSEWADGSDQTVVFTVDRTGQSEVSLYSERTPSLHPRVPSDEVRPSPQSPSSPFRLLTPGSTTSHPYRRGLRSTKTGVSGARLVVSGLRAVRPDPHTSRRDPGWIRVRGTTGPRRSRRSGPVQGETRRGRTRSHASGPVRDDTPLPRHRTHSTEVGWTDASLMNET